MFILRKSINDLSIKAGMCHREGRWHSSCQERPAACGRSWSFRHEVGRVLLFISWFMSERFLPPATCWTVTWISPGDDLFSFPTTQKEANIHSCDVGFFITFCFYCFLPFNSFEITFLSLYLYFLILFLHWCACFGLASHYCLWVCFSFVFLSTLAVKCAI